MCQLVQICARFSTGIFFSALNFLCLWHCCQNNPTLLYEIKKELIYLLTMTVWNQNIQLYYYSWHYYWGENLQPFSGHGCRKNHISHFCVPDTARSFLFRNEHPDKNQASKVGICCWIHASSLQTFLQLWSCNKELKCQCNVGCLRTTQPSWSKSGFEYVLCWKLAWTLSHH